MTKTGPRRTLSNAMHNTAFFPVVYPAAEKYLPDFLRSLEQQSCTDFDLVICNDGLRRLDLSGYRLNTRIVDLSGTPAEIRDAGLRFLRDQGYEQVIFGDCDDFFSPNRVEVSLRLLQSRDVVVNDLDLVDENGKPLQSGYLSRRLGEGDEIAENFIRDKNIFGLSNTAVRVSRLPRGKIPAEVVAVDWFVFATILEAGAKGLFSSAARTFYRQHGANTAGLAGQQSSQKILQAVRVKALHYAAMTAAGLELYRKPAVAFRILHQRLLEDATFKNEYFGFLKSTTRDFPFWWEEAQLPEE